ncbi:MAG: uncharacterized protein PWR13_1383 [Archaeoglobi archaeon]|nr:uncharacterized protein [Archaeoglobi archaeon]
MIRREPARRIFAEEFRDSNLSVKEGEGQYAPSYVITPTGAKCNRLFIVGVLLEKEDIGSDSEYWRLRISDPTGTFISYVGQFQPEALRNLGEIEAPSFIALTGKPYIITRESGDSLSAIRAERISPSDELSRDLWVYDTARATLERLKKLDSGEEPYLTARRHYGDRKEKYMEMVRRALSSLDLSFSEIEEFRF